MTWIGIIPFVLVALSSGFVASPRKATIVAVASVVALAGLGLAEGQGWLDHIRLFDTPLIDEARFSAVVYRLTVVGTLVTGYVAVLRDHRRRMQLLHLANISLSLAQAEAEWSKERLADMNATLEERVIEKTRELELRSERAETLNSVTALLTQLRTPADAMPVIEEMLGALDIDGMQGYVRWAADRSTPSGCVWRPGAAAARGGAHGIVAKVLQEVERTGRTIICEDTGATPEGSAVLEDGSAVRAYLVTPLTVKGRTIGALAALSLTPREWPDTSVDLISIVGSEAAAVFENLHLRIEQARETRRNGILAEIAKILSSSIDLDDSFPAFAERLAEGLHVDRVALYHVDSAQTTATVRRVVQKGGTAVGEGTTATLGGIFAEALERREAVVGSEAAAPEPIREQLLAEGLRTCAAAPLIVRDEVFGLLLIASRRERFLTHAELNFYRQVSTLFAQASRNAHLFDRSEANASELQVLANIGGSVNSSLDLRDIHDSFAREIHGLLPFDLLTIVTQFDDGPTLGCLYVRYENDAFESRWVTLNKDDTLMWWVIENERRALFTDVESELFFYERAFLVAGGYRHAASVPLLSKGRAIGSLSIGSRDVVYTTQHLDLLEKLVKPLALAAENSSLYAEVNVRAQRIAAISNIARAVSSSRRVQDVYAEGLTQLQAIVAFDEAIVAVAHGDQLEMQIMRPGSSAPVEATADEEYDSAALRAEQSPRLVADTELARPSAIDRAVWRRGYRSSLRVPIYIKGAWAGVIMLNAAQPDVYRDDDIEVVDEVANLLGSAIESASLYDELRRHADTDPLTGLANHRAMEVTLEREAARARRTQRPFSILVLDIDNFKVFNDMLGHQAGDRVLRDMARFLDEARRETDVAARMGGDEFCVLLPDTDADGAAAVAERIRASAGQSGVRYPGQDVAITLSVGVASFPAHGESVAEVVRVADSAMYEVKRAGGNGVHIGRGDPNAVRGGRQVSFGLLEMLANAAAQQLKIEPHVPVETSAQVATAIAEQLGLGDEERRALRIAAESHRLGLYAEPFDASRWDELSSDERRRYLQALEMGRIFIRGTPIVGAVLDAAYYHHRDHRDVDADGEYANATPILARVLAVAEAFAGLTAVDGLSRMDAYQRLCGAAGEHLDPQVVAALGPIVGRRGRRRNAGGVERGGRDRIRRVSDLAWSGWTDSNCRPLRPKRSALPG